MNKQIIDELLSAMIDGAEGISDLLFTVGEAHGLLTEFPIKTPTLVFGVKEIDQLADRAPVCFRGLLRT